MKKLLLAIPLAALGVLLTTPAQAAEISVVALPNPIGIPEMMLVIALLGLAIWRKGWIRLVLSICIVIWGVFFIPYDVKIAAPLFGVGTVLFIMGVMAQIRHAREEA